MSHSRVAHNNSGPAAPMEHHVVKRILAGLLAAAFTMGASAANVAPTVAMTTPAANAGFIAPAAITLSANAADSDGTVAKVVFYKGTTLLRTVSTAPYNFNWTNAAAGSYSVTARATDNLGAITISAPLTVTVAVNALPTVSITAPVAGSNLIAPATIALTATAADSDGTIAKVAYYRDASLIGSSTTAPYALNWSSAAAGTYSLTARATDNKGGVTTSAPVSVVVKPNVAPTVAIATPGNNASYAAPGTIALTASAADIDGTVSKVVYYNGPTAIGTATVAPYTVNWGSVAIGSYSITAKATDNKGAVTTSAAVAISVKANVAPTVGITGPANNAAFVSPATIVMTASAADSDGAVTKVAFYRGTTLIGTATSSPFTFSWANAAAGAYSLSAKATDDKGVVTTSAAVAVTVAANVAPSVSITAPANNANFYGPGSLTLTATAADTDGTVAKVEFYSGAALIGAATAAPYSVTWPNVAVGSYSVTAKATDDKGAVKASTAITVKMTAAPVPTVSIGTPANNASFTAPAAFTLTANAAVAGDSISKVEYISGGNVVGTATTAPYAVSLTNIGAGTYTVSAKATGNFGGTATSIPVSLVVNANGAPAVSLSTTAASGTAPAAITFAATAADSDGTIAKVEFYNGATLLATVTQAPYTYTWSDVAAGSYSLTAKATDNLNLETVSAAQTVTLAAPPGSAQVFYIFSDQINTAREITNSDGVKVWQADPEPFGANPPNDNPAGQGKFTYNPRFPGQYFDSETGLHYNYFRDYDPQTGRYVQSDPIGLGGGLNTYAYVGGDPVSYYDAPGLNRTRAPSNGGPTLYSAQVALITSQIRTYNPSFNDPTMRPSSGPGSGYTQADVDRLSRLLREFIRNAQLNGVSCEIPGNLGSGKNPPKGDLPRGPGGDYLSQPGAVGPHSTFGTRLGSDGIFYRQGATFDGNGIFRGRTDVTDHGSPQRPGHVSPHHHPATGPASTGGGVPGTLPYP